MRGDFGAQAQRLGGGCFGAKAVKDGASGHEIHLRAWGIDRKPPIGLFAPKGISLSEPITRAEQERGRAHFASCLDIVQAQQRKPAVLEIPVEGGARKNAPTMCVLKGDVLSLRRDDGDGARRVVVVIGTHSGFEYQAGAVLMAAPPQLCRLTIAVMIDQVTFIEPRKARSPVLAEWLAILDSPRVRVAQVGHRVFESCGKVKLTGARRNWRQQIKSWQRAQEQCHSSRPNSCCSDVVPQSFDTGLHLWRLRRHDCDCIGNWSSRIAPRREHSWEIYTLASCAGAA